MLYAAGALEPEEEARVADHLERGCSECERKLADAEATLAVLATPPEPIEPPARLKGRVMAAIGKQEPDAARLSLSGVADDETAVGAGCDGGSVPESSTGHDRPARWRALSASAAAAAIAAAVVYSGLELSMPSAQQELQSLRAQVQQMREAEDQLNRLSGAMNDWGELVSTLASSARIVPLKEVSGDSDASGRFLLDPEHSTGCLLISGLRPPERNGKGAYRVWLVTKDNEPREVGPLRVDSTGRGWLVADLGSDLSDVVKVNVGYRSDDSEAGETGRTLLAADFRQKP